MQYEWGKISEIVGSVAVVQDVEKEVATQIAHINKLYEIDDHSYRKTLLKTVNDICLYDAHRATILFYKLNWLAVMEQSMFGDDRVKREQALANMSRI